MVQALVESAVELASMRAYSFIIGLVIQSQRAGLIKQCQHEQCHRLLLDPPFREIGRGGTGHRRIISNNYWSTCYEGHRLRLDLSTTRASIARRGSECAT